MLRVLRFFRLDPILRGGGIALLALIGTAGGARAIPPDPERPMRAGSCEEAKARLQEARHGSSLISPAESREVARQAEKLVRRHCGAGQR